MRRSGSGFLQAAGLGKGKKSGVNDDDDSPSSLLRSRLKGSLRGIGRPSGKLDESDAASGAILSRVRKDNARLLDDLKVAEEEVKESERIQEENASLRKEIAKVRQQVVSTSDINAVVTALKDEKIALALLHRDIESLEAEVAKCKKKGKRGRRSD